MQERVSRLQEERAQLRAERQQLRQERRAERQEARQEARAERQQARQDARAERQQARQEAREARAELRAEQRAERRAARQAERDGQTVGTEPQDETTPTPAPEQPAPSIAPPTGITISGNVRQTDGAFQENDVALEDSTVAEDRGVAGVRIEDPADGVTFRFEELGNGQVRATRFEIQDGEEVEAGSQTLLVTSAGNDRGDAFGDLDFDEIGLELELDEEFTPGDLQFVELSSGPTADAEVAAGSLASSGTEPSTAATDRNQSIAQSIVRERQITIELTGEQEALLNLVADMAESGSESPLVSLLSSTDGQSRDEALRSLVQSLVAQDSPDGERALQLLS